MDQSHELSEWELVSAPDILAHVADAAVDGGEVPRERGS